MGELLTPTDVQDNIMYAIQAGFLLVPILLVISIIASAGAKR